MRQRTALLSAGSTVRRPSHLHEWMQFNALWLARCVRHHHDACSNVHFTSVTQSQCFEYIVRWLQSVINEHISTMCWWAEATRVCHRPSVRSVGRLVSRQRHKAVIYDWPGHVQTSQTCRNALFPKGHNNVATQQQRRRRLLHLSRVSTYISQQPTTLRYYRSARPTKRLYSHLYHA